MKEKLPVASSVDCYVFLKKFLMLYSDFFHNVDTFYAYNETIVNIIITLVQSDTRDVRGDKNNQDGGMHYEYERLDKRGSRSDFNGRIPC